MINNSKIQEILWKFENMWSSLKSTYMRQHFVFPCSYFCCVMKHRQALTIFDMSKNVVALLLLRTFAAHILLKHSFCNLQLQIFPCCYVGQPF